MGLATSHTLEPPPLYQTRNPRATALYQLLEAYYEDVKSLWEVLSALNARSPPCLASYPLLMSPTPMDPTSPRSKMEKSYGNTGARISCPLLGARAGLCRARCFEVACRRRRGSPPHAVVSFAPFVAPGQIRVGCGDLTASSQSSYGSMDPWNEGVTRKRTGVCTCEAWL